MISVEPYIPYADSISNKVFLSTNVCEREELIQAGRLGLCQAAKRYQEDSPASFPTFARSRIRGACLDEIRSHDQFDRKHGRTKCLSLDQFYDTADLEIASEKVTLLDFVTSSIDPPDHSSEITEVLEALCDLPEKERQVLSLFFWEGLTDKEIGLLLKLSHSRIQQIRVKAMNKMRRSLHVRINSIAS